MSEDIVARLREGTFGTDETKTDCVLNAYMHRAANEIERLRAEHDALRALLLEARVYVADMPIAGDDLLDCIDAALNNGEQDK